MASRSRYNVNEVLGLLESENLDDFGVLSQKTVTVMMGK